MNRATNRLLLLAALAASVGLNSTSAQAHFAWLATNADGKAIYFFGESVADQTYHLPERLAAAAVHQHTDKEKQEIALEAIDSDDFVGRRSDRAVTPSAILTSHHAYGLYQGSKLTYHAQHLAASPSQWPTTPIEGVPFQAILQKVDGKLVVRILYQGEPLAGVRVQLFGTDGHEDDAAQTDAQGEVSFDSKQIAEGLCGLLVGRLDQHARGELDGQKYTGEADYLTVTFRQ